MTRERLTPTVESHTPWSDESLALETHGLDIEQLRLDAQIEALEQFMVRSLGISAVEGARQAEEILNPQQADPGVLGDVAFEAIIRGGL